MSTSQATKRHGTKRQRAAGAGAPHVPGGATYALTLLHQTKLLDGLGADEVAMLDKGYDAGALWARNDYPDQPIYHPTKARRNYPLTPEQQAENRHLAKYRIIVELSCP